MRYIFFFMLAVNIAYFGYAMWRGERPAPVKVGSSHATSIEPIYLLAENESETSRDKQLALVINNPVRSEAANETNCVAIGPFADLFSGQAVVDHLASLDIAAALRAIDRDTGLRDYRVMIPQATSLQEAFRKLRELKSRNIDSYVITQGKDALAISLGVFSTLNAAEAAQAQRKREGYEAKIVEIQRLEREFWIFGADGVRLTLDEGTWQTLTEQRPDLNRKPMTCPEDSLDEEIVPG